MQALQSDWNPYNNLLLLGCHGTSLRLGPLLVSYLPGSANLLCLTLGSIRGIACMTDCLECATPDGDKRAEGDSRGQDRVQHSVLDNLDVER